MFRREEVPERLHFRASDRIPPVVMIADEGWLIFPEAVQSGAADVFSKGGAWV